MSRRRMSDDTRWKILLSIIFVAFCLICYSISVFAAIHMHNT